MKCQEFYEKISLYIDNELEDIDKKEFEFHLHECQSCKRKYEQMISILKVTNNFEEKELPADYRSSLRSKLEAEVNITKTRKVNWRLLSSIAAGLLLVVVSYGIMNMFVINNTKSFDMEMARENDIDKSEYSADDSITDENTASMDLQDSVFYGNSENGTAQPEITTVEGTPNKNLTITFSEDIKNDSVEEYLLMDSGAQVRYNLSKTDKSKEYTRKIIKNANISIEVSKYDSSFDSIVDFVNNYSGYIENSETRYINQAYSNDVEKENSLKRGYMIIRIPEQNFSETINVITDLGKVQNRQLSETDISDSYYDTENIVKNLEIQEVRLREILNEAKNVDEILRVENELRRIRTEIDRNKGTLKGWDSRINYSTIHVNLIEVRSKGDSIESVDDNIFIKGKKGFIATINTIIDFIEKLLIWIMTIAPILIIILVIVLIAFIYIPKLFNKRK